MKIAIAIATTGRSALIAETLQRLERQTRAADRVIIVVASEQDAPARRPAQAEFVISPRKGAAAQRNYALDLLGEDVDLIVFIDDDYIPCKDFLANVERLFLECPDIVAASGLLLADGAHGPGLSCEEADRLIAAYEAGPSAPSRLTDETGTYGCNMVFRLAAAPKTRFDETLPLYSWLEDTDYSAHFARIGRVVRSTHFAGVHLGVKVGRTSGVRFGYSQMVNAAYLVRKGTFAPRAALRLAAGNFVANVVKSIWPEPWIDRRGRLRGNLLALADLARGRIDPRRVLDL
ncbi:MAG: glycosyltransferase family 2 protein [Methylocystis sp.]|nr:glycosyltransferase family 2 protein [Methylocystis sp.]